MGHLHAHRLIHAQLVPEPGVDSKREQRKNHNSEHDASCDAMHPVGEVGVTVVVLRSVKDDLVEQQPQQRRGAQVLDGDVVADDVQHRVAGLGVHL